MARYSDQVRTSDVGMWGVIAVVAWAIAVLGINLGGLIPDDWLGGLHASRASAGTFNQLRAEMAELADQSVRLRQQNDVLLQRFSLSEQASGDLGRRLGALETTMPNLLEAASASTLDTGTITASTGNRTRNFDTEGGSVSVITTPLSAVAAAPVAASSQPMPQVLATIAPDAGSFGIALGAPIAPADAEATWNGLAARVGTLLVGLGPLLADSEGGVGKRIVAGPIASEAEARALCGRMAKLGIACSSVPFLGEPI